MVWRATPKSAEWHVFQEVDDYNKMRHPIQFFFKDTIPDLYDAFIRFGKDTKWWILHRVHPKHRYHVVDSGLPPGYYDITELMIFTLFSFLTRFIEDEECFECIVWDSDDVHNCVAGELEDLYYWWTAIRVKRSDIESELHNELDDSGIFSKNELSESNRQIYSKLDILEIQWNEEDKYNMKRLVDIKDFMWT